MHLESKNQAEPTIYLFLTGFKINAITPHHIRGAKGVKRNARKPKTTAFDFLPNECSYHAAPVSIP
jgi:hypothetical protein